MKLVCELFRKIHNSTKLYGICSRQSTNITTTATATHTIINANSALNEENRNHFSNQHQNLFLTSNQALSLSKSHSDDVKNGEDYYGAGMFIVVVICFYSLSIVFLTLFNIRFRLVFGRSYGICCCRESTEDHHYESQKEETKNTIHMIFRDSSKLLPVLAITNSYILSAAFSEKLNAIQQPEQKKQQEHQEQQQDTKLFTTNTITPIAIDSDEQTTLTSFSNLISSSNSDAVKRGDDSLCSFNI